MNKRGFTLIELLATITILGMVMVILFPSIRVLIKDSNTTKQNEIRKVLISAADKYIVDERIDFKCGSRDSGGSNILSDTSKNCLNFSDIGSDYGYSDDELGTYLEDSNLNISFYRVYVYCVDGKRKYLVHFKYDGMTVDDKGYAAMSGRCGYKPDELNGT